jgi:hypothetical protein
MVNLKNNALYLEDPLLVVIESTAVVAAAVKYPTTKNGFKSWILLLWLYCLLPTSGFQLHNAGGHHLRHRHNGAGHRTRRSSDGGQTANSTIWPVKRIAEISGNIVIGGLHMVHERQDQLICGPVMPQGGLQAAEVMLYTVDMVNQLKVLPTGLRLGTYILDDCDKDTYGLQQAVDFIKGRTQYMH